jgi:hypothetical protein
MERLIIAICFFLSRGRMPSLPLLSLRPRSLHLMRAYLPRRARSNYRSTNKLANTGTFGPLDSSRPPGPREIADIRFQNRVSEIVFEKTVSERVNPKTISNYRSPIMIACPIFRILEQDYFRPQVDPTSCSKVFATTQDTTPS